MTSSPEPGRSLAAHVQRLTEMMQAMDADQKAYEEWVLRVDADLSDRIEAREAETEQRLAEIRAETEQRLVEIKAETEQRLAEIRVETDRLRAESDDQRRAHQAWVRTVEAQIAQHRETMRGLFDGLIQAQADISRLDAAS